MSTFRNWGSLVPPASIIQPKPRQPRPAPMQSDKLAALRTQILRETVARDYRCDRCRQWAPLLHQVEGGLVCVDCRDQVAR